MRSRLLNQIPKTLRSLTKSTSSQSPTQIQQRHALQQRLFSTNTIKMTRTALGVEGCSLLLLEGVAAAEPNLPRGWDAGVAVDDDGG
mmetsp:Transcript_21884/g.35824  ORF Transcript_21884/g.35824 Transcript_21884/m.35824 type:complete len:87 (-) Transcript_21884:266-526(-)